MHYVFFRDRLSIDWSFTVGSSVHVFGLCTYMSKLMESSSFDNFLVGL